MSEAGDWNSGNRKGFMYRDEGAWAPFWGGLRG